MYYKSPFTGRLSPTTFHVPTKVAAPVVETPVTYTSGTVFPKSQVGPSSPVPSFLLQKMKHFQAPSTLPIHLKGGPVDKVLFGTTVVLCAVGLAGCFEFFFGMAFPPKKAD